MPIPGVIGSDPVLAEAFRHGQTQGRLRNAAQALIEIKRIARDGKRSKAERLLEIEVWAGEAPSRIAGSAEVVDDVCPSERAKGSEA